MITYAYALRKAKEYLMDSEIPLQITYEGEFAEGWYFCYQSKEFLETGELSAQLAGNAPFLIDRQSGELHVLGTAKPLESYLNDYIKTKLRNRDDLVVQKELERRESQMMRSKLCQGQDK